jgi:hypothetical protein
MSPVTTGGKAAGEAITALKGHPLALVLVLVNLCFLAAGTWAFTYVAESSSRRDALLSQLAKDCLVTPAPPKAAP